MSWIHWGLIGLLFFSSWFKYAEARIQIYAGCDMNSIHNLCFLIILSLVCSKNMTFYLTSYWMTRNKLLHACIELGIPPIGGFLLGCKSFPLQELVRKSWYEQFSIELFISVLNCSYHDFLSSSWIFFRKDKHLLFLETFYGKKITNFFGKFLYFLWKFY